MQKKHDRLNGTGKMMIRRKEQRLPAGCIRPVGQNPFIAFSLAISLDNTVTNNTHVE